MLHVYIKKKLDATKDYDLYTNHKNICTDKSLLIAQSARRYDHQHPHFHLT